MATKDDRPGLLSKVALFVRNPTKDWSELDQPVQQEESGYDKQALKAMIERKRQNDFVRRREFDQLRKLRNRDPGASAAQSRQSYFPNSVSTDLDGRADTLKKIDEIEAQMSKQWWKNKTGNGRFGAVSAPAPLPMREPVQGASFSDSDRFGPTVAQHVPEDMDLDFEFAPTQMSPEMLSTQGPGRATESNVQAAGLGGMDASFSTSRLLAMDVDEIANDPELEEAAIRFANGDQAGAENGLLGALRARNLSLVAAQAWLAALLDLYRVCHRHAEFDHAVQEFSAYLEDLHPQWSAPGNFPATRASALVPAVSAGPVLWACPAALGVADMEQLRNAMASAGLPWHLDWSALEQMQSDALPLIDGLFVSLCDEPVSAVFTGVERLLQVSRDVTPSGNRQVDEGWWQLRLNILRALALQDDFELAALDFCVTFERAPPDWKDACCTIECEVDTVAAALYESDASATHFGGSDGPCVLRGEILGDATAALAALDAIPVPGNQLLIGCSGLLRVDFAAAGSILNWVALRQSQGRQIQFHNVHRLVAAFFNVIGINEHAKVLSRPL